MFPFTLMKIMKYLILDTTNILYRTFYVHKQEDVKIITGLAFLSVLNSIKNYYETYAPNKIVLTFDSPNWRKDYTLSEKCVSKKPYKGDRRKNMTPSEQTKYDAFKSHISVFYEVMDRYTSTLCLKENKLEADDLIAGFIDTHPEDTHVLISRDNDFIQLLDNHNLTIIDPFTSKKKTLLDWNSDIDYHMFIKCIRGGEDNIQSARPGIRETKLKKIWDNYKNGDKFEYANFMNESWSDGITTFVVGDLYKENQLLMNLRSQPDDIQILIAKTIAKEKSRQKRFNMFEFVRFCGEHDLKNVSSKITEFANMLNL